MPLPNQGISLSSAGLRGAEALALWQAICRPAVDIRLPDADLTDSFSFEIRTWGLGEVRIGTSRSSAQTATRTPQLIAMSGPPQFLVQLYLEGTYSGLFGSRPVQVGPGDIVLVDMGRTYGTETSDFFHINVLIPRLMLLTVAPHLAGEAAGLLHGHVLRAGSTAAVLVSAQIEAALRMLESGDTVDPVTLRRMILASLSAVLQDVGRGAAPPAMDNPVAGQPAVRVQETSTEEVVRLRGSRASQATSDRSHQLARAITEIEERLADPALGAASLARSLAVSRTGLYRLFQPVGGVTHHIRLRRLQAALLELTIETSARPSVRAVARKWHFTSEGSFSRAFKAQFGVSPSEVRSQRRDRPTIASPSLVTLPKH
jgi:AraC-like DNA-binding protein